MMDNLKIMFWEIFSSMPYFVGSFLFYFLIFLIIVLALKVLSNYIWKYILWIYSLFLYIVVANPNNLLYQYTKKQLFLAIDDRVYTHLYKMDILRREKNNLKLRKIYSVSKIVLIVLLSTIGISLAISCFKQADSGALKYINQPSNVYYSLELSQCKKYNIETRASRKAKKDAEKKAEEKAKKAKKDAQETESVTYYKLNDEGWAGSNIRESPSIDKSSTIITSVSEDVLLEGLGEEETDDRGVVWVKVKTEDGFVGFISTKLVSEYKK